MKKVNILFIVIGLISISIASSFAEEGVSEIVKKANNVAYYKGDDGRAQIKMTIIDSQGRSREREFTILREDMEDGGDQKYYVYFKSPSDVRDMVYMVWKHLDRDDDRWLYLPALDLVRRVASSDKRSSFVGSDFLYEDVSGRSIDLDEHELVENDDEALFKIKNTPKDPGDVDFKYYYVWIDKMTLMPMKAEYYNDSDKAFRIVEALSVETIEGNPTVTKSKATNIESGSHTILEFNDVDYDISLEEDIFTERYLRRPPMEWLE